ncbi:BlaI/MecI/CopY family transcriptional regulator [Roseibacillus ishigakijimensis]|uniref:BlaI/MecI/CopY family transcriptional regulator n=1 Tax=Roseibacillus ishigakijimensis TaxID=454146 RepID=A0A934VNR2_9BACT|nr:BlaI/MecI/CopY family transcriptional regulator [Roseibacillus ishigakijimensis]MBK1835336.1 BlaI/MecI/CopY family transcriptional regulator [Roseibacillus ishigakijimensis]
MPQPQIPSQLELQTLSILWSNGPSTVSQVSELFPDQKKRAYTTYLSVLQNLEKKKLVKSKRSGRANIYSVTKERRTVITPILKGLIQNVFAGSLGEAMEALLAADQLTPEEKTSLNRALRAHPTAARQLAPRKATKKATRKKRAATKKSSATTTPPKKSPKKAKKKVAKKAPVKKATARKSAKKTTRRRKTEEA